jgi:F-type H+-transporting ATPase subunit b
MELVTPNVGTIFWMIIVFGIVVLILRKFAWKSILSALNERERSISMAMKDAKEARKEIDNLKERNEELINEALKEKENILREAMALKDNIVVEAKEKAQAEARNNIDHARQQIQNEKAKAISEMKKQMAEISMMIAEKLIRKEMAKSEEQKRMINNLIDEIKLN